MEDSFVNSRRSLCRHHSGRDNKSKITDSRLLFVFYKR